LRASGLTHVHGSSGRSAADGIASAADFEDAADVQMDAGTGEVTEAAIADAAGLSGAAVLATARIADIMAHTRHSGGHN
jgi:hypothetical protein